MDRWLSFLGRGRGAALDTQVDSQADGHLRMSVAASGPIPVYFPVGKSLRPTADDPARTFNPWVVGPNPTRLTLF